MRAVPRVIALVVSGLLMTALARAQALRPATRMAGSPGALTAYDFHLNAAAFATDDARFGWRATFGGDVDLVDYGRGRVNFLANYEVILGSEIRAFDPNQSVYTLGLSASARWRGAELAAVFHHVSRHVIDRPKQIPIDWNLVGLRASRRVTTAGWAIDAAARALWAAKRSTVDYTFEGGGDAAATRRLTARWAAIAAGNVTALGTVKNAGRGTLWGSWIEGGVRFEGGAGALDVFVAHERRIDADPFDRQVRSWALAGFRLRSR